MSGFGKEGCEIPGYRERVQKLTFSLVIHRPILPSNERSAVARWTPVCSSLVPNNSYLARAAFVQSSSLGSRRASDPVRWLNALGITALQREMIHTRVA